MRLLTKEQIKEVAAEITHSDLPLKTQKFLIDLVNEVNKKYCDDKVDEIAKQLKECKNERD